MKAASEVYAPVGGEISEANAALAAEPAKINADPEGEGWFFRMRLADKSELGRLMTEAQYTEFVKSL